MLRALLSIGVFLFAFQYGSTANAAEVLSFSPDGTVKEVRQVRASFSEPMIAFGDPRGNGDPFDITCPASGHGRWADAKNWVYDFDQDLPAGIRCSFKTKPSLKSLNGSALTGRADFSFDTGGPAIKRADPWEGTEIDEAQIFVLNLDAEADPKSVLEHVYFEVEGFPEKIPVTILDQDPREAAANAKVKLNGKFGAPTRVGTQHETQAQVVIQAKRTFPPRASVTLVWGAGVQSKSGAATQKDQTMPFKVRPEFSAEFSCERENAQSACIPISSMNLNFSAPVAWSDARKIRLRSESGQEWKPFMPKDQQKQDDDGVTNIVFQGPFPERTHFTLTVPGNFKDDAGRELINASRFPLSVGTTEFPPLVKFAADFGIIELKPEAVLPVTVRNVEAELNGTLAQPAASGTPETIQGKVARMGSAEFGRTVEWLNQAVRKPGEYDKRDKPLLEASSELKTETLSIQRPNGGHAFEVIGIPFKKPGFYLVEFKSPRLGASLLGKPAPMYVSAAALVTNLSVHFKNGRDNSLVWVTTLNDAKPVADATIAVRDCMGTLIASAKTDSKGIATLTDDLSGHNNERCAKEFGYSQYANGLYVTAEKGDDFSFVHTSWQKGIESWRFNLPSAYILSPEYGSTVFDRTLFRAGETVHMKHFLREHTMNGIETPVTLPGALRITHQEGNETYEFPLTWRGNAVAESSWTIPKDAKLGVYNVTLVDGDNTWPTGDFRVEEFRVPLMRAQLKPPAESLVHPNEVPVDLSVQYLAGGAASKLPVDVRYQTSSAEPIEFPLFDGYVFGTGRVKDLNSEEPPLAPGEVELDLNAAAPTSTTGPEGASKAQSMHLALDGSGTARVKIPVSSRHDDQVKNLHIELDYRDPNGETQTAGRTVSLYPSARLVGIRPDSWFATKNSLKFQVAVADLKGNPVKNAPVTVEFVEQKNYSHRKRLVGGFYAYENRFELKRHGKACSGKTDEKGLLSCDSQPPVAGNLILEAKTTDEDGRDAYSYSSTWVYDSEELWFAQDESDRIDLLPERKHYEVGEKAVFQVRMPFREATALVTVEREGILDSFVVHLSGKKPLIEVPIQPEYGPNVFVSALVVRGRVGDVQPTALVDLGRPAYKLGISQINVGWKPHELAVRVIPSKDVYQVREKGHFKIQVKTASGEPLPKGTEVALAAVDEGLLELKANDSWKLLDAMMRPRGYEVETYTAQSEVVGKRHFGLKALPFGGDGGKAPAREIFDSLLYWNGRITLDRNGEAEVQIPMNDSITGFKLAAVAHSGLDMFGTGYASIRTTQDLMILSGIPPLAREGDHLPLEFTLRNTTAKPMTVELAGKAKGLPDYSQEVVLQPNEAKQVQWNVDIPRDVQALKYELTAQQKNGKAADRIRITQKIAPAVPVRVYQATLAQLDGKFELPVEKPKDALAGAGGIRVALDSTLLTGLNGVRDYMHDYPYTCLEQRASKAIALRDKKLWKSVVDDLPTYLDADGLAKYFPADWIQGSDILSSYLVSVSNEAGWDLPEDVRKKILEGLKGFVEGRITRISDLATADLTIRKLSALEALSRYGEATWAMTGSLQISPNLWPTSAVIDWSEILKRIKDAPDLEAQKKQADQILRSRLNFQGTMMTFSTENVDQLWWMMVSTSTNANRFLLSALDNPAWRDDLGRVARGALNRQSHGAWDTTTANAWGVLAMEKFAHEFEKTPVSGTTRATLGSSENSMNWNAKPHGGALDFEWPSGPASIKIAHDGGGKPWITVQSRAAIPLREPLSTGYRVKKTYTPIEQRTSGKWSKGDVIRVHLDMESQSDMTWVVVNDPIPAGATILGSGLGNDSQISSGGEKSEGWAEPTFQERAFDGYRAYYGYTPKGKWSTEYTIRLNQSGKMNLPPTRVEAMYAPEMFGELPNEAVSIQE